MNSVKTLFVPGRLVALMSCVLLSGMAGCASQPVEQPPDPRITVLQQNVQELERRIEALERRNKALSQDKRVSSRTDHQLTRGEVVSELQTLYLERDRLLRRFTPKHPDIRLLDEEIAYLRDQLRGAGEKTRP